MKEKPVALPKTFSPAGEIVWEMIKDVDFAFLLPDDRIKLVEEVVKVVRSMDRKMSRIRQRKRDIVKTGSD